jgi:hypothetical protein
VRTVRWISVAAATAGALVVLEDGPATAAVVRSTAASSWQTDGRVRAIAMSGGRIYLGGSFTHVRAPGAPNGGAVRNHLAALDAGTGVLLPWNPGANGQVRALAIKPGGKTIFAGGRFTAIGGHPRTRIAAIATHGSKLRRWHPRANGPVSAILARPRRVYIGGAFTTVNGRSRPRIAAISTKAGAKLRAWHGAVGGGDVRALALDANRNRLYVGGWFTHVNGKAHRHLAALDTASGATRRYRPRPSWPVAALKLGRMSLYAAGAGNGGQVAAYKARTGSVRWLAITDGDVVALAVRQGVLYAGGHFLNYCQHRAGSGHPLTCRTPVGRRHLLALNTKTAHLARWNPGTNSVHGVFALRASPAQLVAGGDFPVVYGG